eukprot:446160-Prorocentrum_minimum.AAC.5
MVLTTRTIREKRERTMKICERADARPLSGPLVWIPGLRGLGLRDSLGLRNFGIGVGGSAPAGMGWGRGRRESSRGGGGETAATASATEGAGTASGRQFTPVRDSSSAARNAAKNLQSAVARGHTYGDMAPLVPTSRSHFFKVSECSVNLSLITALITQRPDSPKGPSSLWSQRGFVLVAVLRWRSMF